MDWFFCVLENYPTLKRKDGTMVNIIKDITFLIFNYSNEIFIENLSNKIKLSELENYLKSI